MNDDVVVNSADRFRNRHEYVHGSAARAVDPRPDVVDVDPVEVVDEIPPTSRRRARAVVDGLVDRVRARSAAPVPAELLVGRDRRRARRQAVARATWSAAWHAGVQTGRGGGRLVWIVAAGVGRWVWMPDQAHRIEQLDDGDQAATALRERRALGRSRAQRAGALCALGAVAWFAVPLVAERVDAAVTHWWEYGAFGAACAVGCWAIGGFGRDDADPTAGGVELPRGLSLGMSERAVTENIVGAFAKLKIEGMVVKVRAASWGWTISAEVLTALTETHIGGLARVLDTRVGGVLASTVDASSRSRVLRLVMVDLLAPGIAAPPLALTDADDIRTPVVLANRFDGGELTLALAEIAILIIGATGSGKSTALHRIIESFFELGAVVGGIDLSGGGDLRSWEPMLDPRLTAIGDKRGEALAALDLVVAMAKNRKATLGRNEQWVSTRERPPIRMVIDEYGLVAESPVLRELVGWIATYGRSVDVEFVAANHRITRDMMGDSKVASQVQVTFYFAMDAADARQLPKSVREQGVAPELLTPAHHQDVHDAGKAFVHGVGTTPFLVRFGAYRGGEAARRADALAERRGRAVLHPDDQAVVDELAALDAGVPALLLDVVAVIEQLGADHNPVRANSDDIAAGMRGRGYVDMTTTTLTGKIREALGAAYPVNRVQDMNLNGANRKGWRRDDLLDAIDAYRELKRGK